VIPQARRHALVPPPLLQQEARPAGGTRKLTKLRRSGAAYSTSAWRRATGQFANTVGGVRSSGGRRRPGAGSGDRRRPADCHTNISEISFGVYRNRAWRPVPMPVGIP
jgi:hypothetical protein